MSSFPLEVHFDTNNVADLRKSKSYKQLPTEGYFLYSSILTSQHSPLAEYGNMLSKDKPGN